LKVLLIIPAHNEAENLPALISGIRTREHSYDAVVIDDASSDKTAYVAARHGVPVLRLAANLGIGGAVQTGFKYAAFKGYDIAVQFDGDGQHDPACIETIVGPVRRGEADCVIGSRYMRGRSDTDYETPLLRRIGMYFSSGMLFLATGVHVTDTTSGFRALSRPAFEFFARAYPVDHPEAEALLMLHQKKFHILEVPVKMRGRVRGESLFTFTKALLYPLRVIIGFIGLLLNKQV